MELGRTSTVAMPVHNHLVCTAAIVRTEVATVDEGRTERHHDLLVQDEGAAQYGQVVVNREERRPSAQTHRHILRRMGFVPPRATQVYADSTVKAANSGHFMQYEC